MRFRPLFLLLAAATGVVAQDPAPMPQPPWVTETPTEFFGRLDAVGIEPERWVVADRATGLVRWVRFNGSAVESVPVRASGLARIETAAIVQAGGSSSALVVGERGENRLASVPDRPLEEVVPVFLGGITGPSALAAVQSQFTGADPLSSELLVGSVDNGAPRPFRLTLHLLRGLPLYPSLESLSEPLRAGHSFRLARGGPEVAGFLSGDQLRVWSATVLGIEPTLSIPGVAPGSDWVADFFRARSEFAGLLFYRRGRSTLDFRQTRRAGAGQTAATDPVSFDLGIPVDALISGGVGSDRWLLALSGTDSRLFEFDGEAAPRLRQSFSASGGSSFTAAAIRSDGGLLLLEGTAGRSESWNLFRLQEGRHVLESQGRLADLPTGGRRGSQVFAFTADPVRNRDAAFRALGRASDWGTSVIDGIRVLAETDRGPASGLGDATPTFPDIRGAAGSFLVVNQLSPAHSLFSFAEPESTVSPRIRFEPGPGRFSQPMEVVVSVQGLAFPTVYVQVGSDPAWSVATGPVRVTTNLTLRAWARGMDGVNTPVTTAVYRIQDSAPLLPADRIDRNGNGIPDEGEQNFPIDGDLDGDTYPDGEELAAGSDPADPRSVPAGSGGGDRPVLVLLGTDVAPEPRIRLRLLGRPGVLHAVQSAEAITPESWTDAVPAAVMPESGSLDFTLPMTQPEIRFFRGQSR